MPGDIVTKNRATDKTRTQASDKTDKVPGKKVTRKPAAASKPQKTSKKKMAALTLILDPVLVINSANELHGKFAPFIDNSCNEIVIDASSVEMIDTAILQLLFSLINSLKSNNTRVMWRSPSAEFVSRVRSLGLSQIFDIDRPIEG